MKGLAAIALVVLCFAMGGCAQRSAPEERGYSVAESRELALEVLNRRGLSFDEYQRRKAELLGQDRQHCDFDSGAETHAGRGVDTVAPRS